MKCCGSGRPTTPKPLFATIGAASEIGRPSWTAARPRRTASASTRLAVPRSSSAPHRFQLSMYGSRCVAGCRPDQATQILATSADIVINKRVEYVNKDVDDDWGRG